MKPTYSIELAGYAAGKTVQFQDDRLNDSTGWHVLEADNTEVWTSLLRTDGRRSKRFKFRLKPRTVKVGNREIEAPVLEPAEGQKLWFVGSDGEAYANTPGMLDFDIASGRAFATKEAALAADAAVTALMRGES